MSFVFVVEHADDFPSPPAGATLLTARDYLTDPSYANIECCVVNLCRTHEYQGRGYYVSLLAEARGHRPLPDVKTIEDAHSETHAQALAAQLVHSAQQALLDEAQAACELTFCFGHDAQGRCEELGRKLFEQLRAPIVRARFRRSERDWQLDRIVLLSAADLGPAQRAALGRAAIEFACGRAPEEAKRAAIGRPRIAILRDPEEADPPSNAQAIERFAQAAADLGLAPEAIGPGEMERLSEFNALFIRATTNVAHYTYDFSRRAEELGLVVIDDPESILKCTNKVYLHELMARHHIPTPRTLAVHRENLDQVAPTLGLPCILKQPDSAFSLGVAKIESQRELERRASQLFERSELLIAQQWLPTEFDWRVCVLDRRPLLVCRYFMAPGHWQVIKRDAAEARLEGMVETLSVAEAPEQVVDTAVRAANLIGSGLYGVDLKQVGGQCYLIEVNDNPNIDAGNEDRVLQGALYREVMGLFARRISANRALDPSA